MVSLVHHDIKSTLSDSEKAALIAPERHSSTTAAGSHKAAASLDANHPGRAVESFQVNAKQSKVVVAPNSSGLDDAAFFVSGPLLPIRQARRGANPNRNYRIIDTRTFMATDFQQVAIASSIREGGSGDMGYMYSDAIASNPTLAHSAAHVAASSSPSRISKPASGVGSARTSSSSNSSSNSGGSSISGKSTIASLSTTNSLSDTVSTSEDIYSGRSRQIRLYDKHRVHDVHELPMEPITLSSRHSTHPTAPSSRSAHSYGLSTHALELDGRSGTVRVSSLLPGARTASPNPSSRRVPLRHAASSSSDALGGGPALASQHYLVQRVPAKPHADQGRSSAEANTPHPTTQIKLSSPQARYLELQRSLSPDLLALNNGLSAPEKQGAINGDTPAYFADSEMDGNFQAALGENTSSNGAINAANKAKADATDRGSWNVSSDEGSPNITERQRRRLAVRASVTTEKYYVRPVALAPAAGDGAPNGASNGQLTATPRDSPIAASLGIHGTSPLSASFSLSSRSEVSSGLYEESSADEQPALPAAARSPSADQEDEAAATQDPKPFEQVPSLSPGHRATSFDLGVIGRPIDSYRGAFRRAGLPASVMRTPSRASIDRDGSMAFSRTRTRSSDRLATPGTKEAAGSVEKAEEGYEGDSEGLVRSAHRVPVQRRNTVAGDKVDDISPMSEKTSAVKLPRNTGDFSDLLRGKEERRTLRGSRRKSATQAFMPIGTQISPGHANYVLMYNMLTGIRVSVSRCEAKDSRPVRAEDYIAAHKYSFDVVGDEMTPSSRYDFKFKDYAPWAFRCIREAFHLSTEEYLVSLTDKYILSEVGSSGKSGSFFYYSQDYRFIIKTVHHTEHKFMRQILPQYYEFVRDHPNTLLSRIYGLHRIKLPQGRKVHFIVMSNILPPNKDIHAQFDLKGSMLGRELSPELAAKPRACMKDKNWINMRQRLHLGPTKRHEFVKQLIEDVTLLIRLNIMDYSLLIGIHDLSQGNAAKLRDTTLSMFDPQTTEVQQQNRLTRAHTIRKKVVRTDPVALDSLPLGTVPPLPESMFQELRYSMFYREDGGILSTNENDDPAQLIYYLGVIDILTPYNMVKRTEHIVKAIVHDGSQISAVNPRRYGLRFLRFMIRSLSDCTDVLPLLEEFERTTYQEICREHRII